MKISSPLTIVVACFAGVLGGMLPPPGLGQDPQKVIEKTESEHAVFHRALKRISTDDEKLKQLIQKAGITPLDRPPESAPELIRLGRFLYYDKILSGNRDISCATCHHDRLMTGDACSLSVGTGSDDFGPLRTLAPGRKFTPRNAPDVFNRGLPEWQTMFWDSRVEFVAGQFLTPAKADLPGGFTHVLQVQAMFPVTSRTEMRGNKGDRDVFGNPNEIAAFDDKDFRGMWQALMDRLLGPEGARNKLVPSYRQLFRAAFPETPLNSLGFQHAAAAIAAYERSAYTLLDSPWDRYLQGEDEALPPAAKRGAILFYGKADCVACHSGNLMTDQKHHNILIPHIGSLELNERDNDLGRARETKRPSDNYKFRTPPLRNVAETGPWMHNGLYTTLEATIRHHLDPIRSFQNYDTRQLTMPALKDHVHNSDEDLETQLSTFSEILKTPPSLSKRELSDLIQFLHALTSPSLKDLERNVPPDVPSGLVVD